MAKIWKQSKCLSTNEQIKTMYTHRNTHMMDYYSAIKEDSNLAIWGNMDGPGEGMLTKISQTEKTNNAWFQWNRNKQNKTETLIDTKNKLLLARK